MSFESSTINNNRSPSNSELPHNHSRRGLPPTLQILSNVKLNSQNTNEAGTKFNGINTNTNTNSSQNIIIENLSTSPPRPPKIAIIGGGWYGCHLALTLRERGAIVTVFEKNHDIFQEASGNNQFRLHFGFHYPRSYKTRMQIMECYQKFIERYGSGNGVNATKNQIDEQNLKHSNGTANWSQYSADRYQYSDYNKNDNFTSRMFENKNNGTTVQLGDMIQKPLSNQNFFTQSDYSCDQVQNKSQIKSGSTTTDNTSKNNSNSSSNSHFPLCAKIRRNLYAIAKTGSLLDFETYCQIMQASGAKFERIDPLRHGLVSVEGVLATPDEQIIFTQSPTEYFREKLGVSLDQDQGPSYSTSGKRTSQQGSESRLRQESETQQSSSDSYRNINKSQCNQCLKLNTEVISVSKESTNKSDQLDAGATLSEERRGICVKYKEKIKQDRQQSEQNQFSDSVQEQIFDWTINCTYGRFLPIPGFNTFYEPCVTLVYRYRHLKYSSFGSVSITIMDGPKGCSLYPYVSSNESLRKLESEAGLVELGDYNYSEYQQQGQTNNDVQTNYSKSQFQQQYQQDSQSNTNDYNQQQETDSSSDHGLYTLTSVEHTPLGLCKSEAEVQSCVNKVNANFILTHKRDPFEKAITHHYPRFPLDFELFGWFTSVKTKLVDSGESSGTGGHGVQGTANRECLVEVDENIDRLIHVMSGKINTIFEAESKVFDIVNKFMTLDGQLAQPFLHILE